MSRALVVLLLCLFPAAAQDWYSHRVSGAFGALSPVAGWQAESFDTAPLLSFDYGFRFNRYGSWDAGVDVAFASENRPGATGDTRRNLYIPRTGYSLVVPFWRDRIEAQVGAGAAYIFIKPTIPGYEKWLVYLQGRGTYALDRDRKFRAGVVTRWYRDPIGVPVMQWVSVAAEASYSWGR